MIWEVLEETSFRTFWIAIVVIPVLFLVEYLNHRYGEKLIKFFEKRKKMMPFWAALLSMLPGCNVAAAIAVLYTKKLVSVGALISAMIATSDEAIYVFIPARFNFLPLFAAKFLFAVLAGFTVDTIIKFRESKINPKDVEVGYCCSIHEHHEGLKGMIKHTLNHGIKIIFFVFIVLFGFNLLKDFYGFDKIGGIILASGPYQPLLAGLFGLLPGCGTSVVLATLYIQGILTFSGAFAGLSVASGDVAVVLLANKISKKELLQILIALLILSIIVGYLIKFISTLL